jgi:hypothetical protein
MPFTPFPKVASPSRQPAPLPAFPLKICTVGRDTGLTFLSSTLTARSHIVEYMYQILLLANVILICVMCYKSRNPQSVLRLRALPDVAHYGHGVAGRSITSQISGAGFEVCRHNSSVGS